MGPAQTIWDYFWPSFLIYIFWILWRYGGSQATTFCCLMTLWHQLHFEGGVDIYQLAKLAHYNRPGILKSPEDLLFLYCALEVGLTSRFSKKGLYRLIFLSHFRPMSPTMAPPFHLRWILTLGETRPRDINSMDVSESLESMPIPSLKTWMVPLFMTMDEFLRMVKNPQLYLRIKKIV